MRNFSIIRQAGTSGREPLIAAQYAMTFDVPVKAVRMESLDEHAKVLQEGPAVPIGSVEFVRKAMSLSGIAEPANISYPEVLSHFLYRDVKQRRAGSVLGNWFIKPVTTKAFTGFVFDTIGSPENLSDHDREQYNAFMLLPPDTMVWVSEPVTWCSEYRYYVINREILGEGRYDDGPDEAPVPDMREVNKMVKAMARAKGAPAAFSLDVGVLGTGETALVECNDAWALGYYKGTLFHQDYMRMLVARWRQLRITNQC